MFTVLSRVLAFASLILLAVSAWQFSRPPVPTEAKSSLKIDWPGPDLGQRTVGRHEISIRITNTGRRTCRLAGMMNTCALNGCAAPILDGPVTVLPGETLSYSAYLKVGCPGAFRVPIVLYIDDKDMREIVHEVYGTAISLGATRDGPKSKVAAP